MKKMLLNILCIIATCFTLTGCCLSHEWNEATCTAPKTCAKCGETEGEMLAHTWIEATCEEAKHCSACGKTEGEPLEHTWIEATCEEAKHCSVCGTVEGEALAHTLTEANYQQAPTCTVCGKTEGEPLIPIYEEWEIDEYGVELDKVYDLEMSCFDNTAEKTLAKIVYSNYQTFESDDTHPAKEGYEWKTVDITTVVGDNNANKYGVSLSQYWDDYYCWINNDIEGKHTVIYNGIEYTDCEIHTNETGEWKYKEQYGWNSTLTINTEVDVLVPIGYDGFIYGFYDKYGDVNKSKAEIDVSEYIYFRFK